MIWGFFLLALPAFLLSAFPSWAKEEDKYPKKQITFVIPMEPGSSMDSAGRPLADLLQKELGQPLMIVNKPGAAGTIGLRDVYEAKPDGYTIGIANTVHYAKLLGLVPFDHHDMTLIGIPSGAVPAILCNAARPWKSVGELIDYAKSNPGVKVATTSKGAYWWLATKAFEKTAGLKMNVLAQPGGGAMVVTQAAGGHTDLGVCGLPESRSQIQAGNIRLLAVFGRHRVPGYEAPTLIESGCNVEVLGVVSLVAPKGVPKPVYDVLAQSFERAVKNPVFQKTMAQMGAIVIGMVSDEAIKFMDEQANVLRPLLTEAGLIKNP
jgi:tripartite-type tricarboxylate transporter receptor subunit TctC